MDKIIWFLGLAKHRESSIVRAFPGGSQLMDKRRAMKQFSQEEKERLYPVLAKVAEYLIERIAEKERQQTARTASDGDRKPAAKSNC